jgi:hypothetical protein
MGLLIAQSFHLDLADDQVDTNEVGRQRPTF